MQLLDLKMFHWKLTVNQSKEPFIQPDVPFKQSLVCEDVNVHEWQKGQADENAQTSAVSKGAIYQVGIKTD